MFSEAFAVSKVIDDSEAKDVAPKKVKNNKLAAMTIFFHHYFSYPIVYVNDNTFSQLKGTAVLGGKNRNIGFNRLFTTFYHIFSSDNLGPALRAFLVMKSQLMNIQYGFQVLLNRNPGKSRVLYAERNQAVNPGPQNLENLERIFSGNYAGLPASRDTIEPCSKTPHTPGGHGSY